MRVEEALKLLVVVVVVVSTAAWCARSCETVLTPAEIAADRSRGVLFARAQANALFGYAVVAAGDVNDDGFDDFVLAATFEGFEAGALYVVFGRSAADWASATFDFNATADTPDASSWIRISAESNMRIGSYGIAPGDFNGDGVGDLLFGSLTETAFCVFGHSGAWSSFNTTEIESGAALGFVLTSDSSTASYAGNAGDMNGDGIEDILVADSVNPDPSTAYVVFGVAGTDRDNFNLSAVDGADGFALHDGSSMLCQSEAIGSAGDVDGDGLADLAIGSYGFDNYIGNAYVLFARNVSTSGQWAARLNLTSELDGTNGFVINGPSTYAYLGFTVVGAGDVNADGYEDIFIGSAGTGSNGAWIVFGHPAPWTSPLNASELDGTNGFHFASDSGTRWGWSGGGAGDVDGDGIDDIVVGGSGFYNATGSQSGAAVVLFGRGGAWPAELNCYSAVGSVGFLIDGPEEGSYFGQSARGAGDVNGDGLADFLVGAPWCFSNAGFAALVFGVEDHCAVCSNSTEDACLICDDGFFLNDTICANASLLFSSSSSSVASSSSSSSIASSSSYSSSSSSSSIASSSSSIASSSSSVASSSSYSSIASSSSSSSSIASSSSYSSIASSSSSIASSSSSIASSSSNGASSSISSVAESSSSSIANSNGASSSNSFPVGPFSSSSLAPIVRVVVVINFLDDVDVSDPEALKQEIATALCIDAGMLSVVVISPTEVEVTLVGSEELAARLVEVVDICTGDA